MLRCVYVTSFKNWFMSSQNGLSCLFATRSVSFSRSPSLFPILSPFLFLRFFFHFLERKLSSLGPCASVSFDTFLNSNVNAVAAHFPGHLHSLTALVMTWHRWLFFRFFSSFSCVTFFLFLVLWLSTSRNVTPFVLRMRNNNKQRPLSVHIVRYSIVTQINKFFFLLFGLLFERSEYERGARGDEQRRIVKRGYCPAIPADANEEMEEPSAQSSSLFALCAQSRRTWTTIYLISFDIFKIYKFPFVSHSVCSRARARIQLNRCFSQLF